MHVGTDMCERAVNAYDRASYIQGFHYKPEFVAEAAAQCAKGATDQELADYFGVSVRTLYRWKNTEPE